MILAQKKPSTSGGLKPYDEQFGSNQQRRCGHGNDDVLPGTDSI
jgi:hypothetical protein